MKRPWITVLLASFVALYTLGLGGCNLYRPHFLTLRANYNVSRGEYQTAIVDYLRAREGEQYNRWLAYNLGTIYHFLGESDAALDRWEEARDASETELVFHASFNRGVFFLEQARYREARNHFRTALELKPASEAAKRNMEITLDRLHAETDLTGEVMRGEAITGGVQESAETTTGQGRMLDYMRRREEQRWRATQQLQVSPDVEDW